MKAVRGYTKDNYRKETAAPIVKEFTTIDQAAAYLAKKYGACAEYMTRSIMDDTNGDAIYFEDGTVIIYEL